MDNSIFFEEDFQFSKKLGLRIGILVDACRFAVFALIGDCGKGVWTGGPRGHGLRLFKKTVENNVSPTHWPPGLVGETICVTTLAPGPMRRWDISPGSWPLPTFTRPWTRDNTINQGINHSFAYYGPSACVFENKNINFGPPAHGSEIWIVHFGPSAFVQNKSN